VESSYGIVVSSELCPFVFVVIVFMSIIMFTV